MKVKFIIIIILLILILGGCKGKSQDNIDIVGEITNITYVNNSLVGILVEGKKEENTNFDKAYIKIDKNTKIKYKVNNETIKPKDLKKGMKVEVIFEGPVAESYPVQTYGKKIYITNK